jgi:hypothetical protein
MAPTLSAASETASSAFCSIVSAVRPSAGARDTPTLVERKISSSPAK